ncbi:uncharacterized protein LY89DRAFT_729642 [Mollisia scopiformis]|uniref:DUF5648 domain-containing protein n=1 Tax=Mollisia scopiformis TaxID=149040 RepID=A0A194XPJ9_MOLSC|nr:uncharacterized protein LY89DRAFT_729642 [Mollisia scopiformis]KUJ22175.1 hypothetical protein LY89DRAFT_729642 [Mollisia scopiformis]
MADHFYTTDPHGGSAPASGYHLEEIACYVATTELKGTVPIYQWYNPSSKLHFYTTDFNGELAPQAGYEYEKIAFYAFSHEATGTVPFYRWVGSKSQHFYTISDSEGANSGMKFEGITAYVHPGATEGFAALYRRYSG